MIFFLLVGVCADEEETDKQEFQGNLVAVSHCSGAGGGDYSAVVYSAILNVGINFCRIQRKGNGRVVSE